MIRIFKLVLLLVVSQVAFGQAPTNYTNINGRYRWIAGMFDSTFHIPKGTTPSLRTGGSTNAGGLFYNTADSSVYTYTGTQWIKLRGTIIDTTSLSNRINLKLNISDTASMLSPYLRKVDTASLSNRINLKVNISDTASMLLPYLRKIDTASLSNRINLKVNISDTASMLTPYLRKVDTTNKFVTQVYKKNASDSVFYVKGGNHLWAFNDSTGSAGGGGGGKIYYFNGGVSMGTFGGFTMYELGDTANTGAAANFTRATTGNIANFITDPGKPGLLQIPAGVWTIDAYLSETGGGSNNAEIYVQVEKWDGSTITTIATSPIEQITNGSVIDLYTWSVSIPTTSLAVTDRIIIQFYIQNTNGKTVTLYTQNGYVGEVHTTFTTGIGAINGLTAPAQYLSTGTSGTDFNISSVTATHTFNLPTASATNRGALSTADWTAFNNKGSVSSVATNNATGITGGTITTTGTLAIDTTVISTRLWRQKGIDSVQSNLTAGLALKVNISDTASMLSPYLRKVDTASLSNRINLKVNISDTASMLSPYLRKVDTASLSNRINTKLNISDTATMLGNYVNNVGYGLTKASQVVSADSATLSAYYLRRKDSLTSTNLLGYVTRKVLADSAAAIRAAAGGGSISGSGTTNYIPKFTSSTAVGNSQLFDDGTNVGIGTATAGSKAQINGNLAVGYSTSTAAPTNGLAVAGQTNLGDLVLASNTTKQMNITVTGNNSGVNSGSSLNAGTSGVTSVGIGNRSALIGGASFNSQPMIYWGVPSSNLAFNNGSDRMTITSGGSVGIATTTIGSTLQVNGNAAIGYSASTAAPTNGLAVSGNTVIGNNTTTRNFEVYANGLSDALITSVADNNSAVLSVFNNGGTSGNFVQIRAYGNTTGATLFGLSTNKLGAIYTNGDNGFAIGTAAATNLVFGTNNVERMRITSGGTLIVGNGETAASPSTGIISGTGGSGTNIAGAEFRIRGGASTGSGAGGPITFYTAAAGASGTTVRAATEVGRFTSAGDFAIGATSANSKLHVAGSLRLPITTKTGTYTLDATDYTVVFNLNGNATANLPDATTIPGRIYVIKINRTNVADTLTIDPNGAQTIDGNGTIAIQCQYAVTIQSDGTNWRIIGDYAQGLNCL